MNHSRGFNVIELTVAIGAGLFVMVAMTTMAASLQNQNRTIEQKQELLEMKAVVLQEFGSPGLCSWHFAQPAFTLDVSGNPSQTNPSPSVIELTSLHMAADSSAPVIAKAGELLPGTQTGLRVDKILLKDVYATGRPDEYRGTIEIRFGSQSAAANLRPVRYDISILTAAGDPATAKHISSCGHPGAARTRASAKKFCNTYQSGNTEHGCASPTADGRCHIDGSESAAGCFLTGVDDDTARIGFAGNGAIPIGTQTDMQTLNRVDLEKDLNGNDISAMQKCEVAPEPSGGGWFYRAWFSCEVVTCTYACIF